MSSNQKQTAAGGPQTQRYTSSPYQPITPTVTGTDYDYAYRPEGYQVSTPPGPPFVPPPNQGGNQGPALRGPSGPPNQSSTPPNVADIKVSSIPQQAPLNPMFVSQSVRPQPGNYYTRTSGPPSQPNRMANHSSRPQQPPPPLYTPTQPQFMSVPQMYIAPNNLQYGYGAQRPSFIQPPVQVYSHMYPFSNPPTQSQQVSYNYYPATMMQRQTTIPQSAATNPSTQQNTLPSVPLVSNTHQTFSRNPPHKRRPKALQVIDPDTGADRLQEIFEDNSHPPSGESSARQTPQPSASHNKEVQATFSKLVLQAISGESPPEQHHPHRGSTHPQENQECLEIEYDAAGSQRHGIPPVQQQPIIKMEHVVQSSKLQAEAKEFVLPPVAKETPVVSANIDAIEVTLPNKLPKDRESPNKVRKPREQTPKVCEPTKEIAMTAAVEKVQPILIAPIKEDFTSENFRKSEASYAQDISSSSINQSTNQPQVPLVSKESEVLIKDVSGSLDKQQQPQQQPLQQPQQQPLQHQQQQPQHQHQQQQPQQQHQHQQLPQQQHQHQQPQQQHQHQQNRPPPIQQPLSQSKKELKEQKEPQPKVVLERQDSIPSVSNIQTAPAQDNAKKPSVARLSSKQGTGGANQKTNQNVLVPQPQPSKSASKSHKKNELNLKGANKEGTDMDAFNDNAPREVEVNSNMIPKQINSNNNMDVINANSLPQTNNVTFSTQPPLVRDVNVNIATNKKFENEVTTKPPEPVVKSVKTKIDITDIVKERPKNIKPYNCTVEGHDELDKASSVHQNEKMVLAKNDANARSDISRVENKLPYTNDQWSPANQNGLKKYQKDFLLALKDTPASRVVPENILEALLPDEKNRLSDGRLSMGGRTDFNPAFNTYGRNSSQKGTLASRLSGSKMDRGKGNKGSIAKPTVKVSISVREDVKLHETENAWRPARHNKGDVHSDDDKRTAELYRKVRGILNKLTPQKFETLLQQIRTLEIINIQRLQGVIDLIFEKAVDEPNFSVAYASMCSHLALLQVPLASSTSTEDFVNFRKLLITKCQLEFEKQSIDESIRNTKMNEIEKCNDLERKKELEFDLEDYDRRLRMKSVGIIRFIGELFKQNMLTVNIMMRCLHQLLDNKDEESLECLCKLLTTVGKELETKPVTLNPIFHQIKNIAEKKDANSKITSRIRFMLQDVLDLRNSKWVPRRQDLKPKMIDQIQKEADQEQLNIQIMNSGQGTPRKDDRGGGGSGGQGGSSMNDRKGGRSRNITTDEGWTLMNNRGKNSFTVQSDKLKAGKTPMLDEPLGNRFMFNKWLMGSGSNVKTSVQQDPNTVNMYSALENIEGDRRTNSRHGQKESYHSKGTSLEKGNYRYDSRGGSRSGSQHRSNDSSASSSQRGTPAPSQMPAPRPQPQVAAAPIIAAVEPTSADRVLTEEQRSRLLFNAVGEYVCGNCTVDEFFSDICSFLSTTHYFNAVNDCFLHGLEKSQAIRLKTGELFAKLVVQNKIPANDYRSALEDLLSQADDLKIDIPKIWDYLAESLVDLIVEEPLPLTQLPEIFSLLIEQRQADKLLAPLLKFVASRKGSHFLHNKWRLSGLQFSQFMENTLVDSFIVANQFDFLLGEAAPIAQNQLSYEDLQAKILSFLQNNQTIDEIHNWVLTNMGENGAEDKKFIRALATAIFKDSINMNHKLMSDKFEQHNQLLHKYVDNRALFELECLYALQALIHKMEHPQGLLLLICDKLYELGTFSQESFVTWERSKDPAEQEGKGVALKQLTSFFCQLKENDDDESTGSDPDIED